MRANSCQQDEYFVIVRCRPGQTESYSRKRKFSLTVGKMEKVQDMQFIRLIYELQDDTPALGFYLNEYLYDVKIGANQRQMCVRMTRVLTMKVQVRVR